MPELLRVIARLNMGGPARHVIRVTAPLRCHGWRTILATGCVEEGEADLIEEAREAGMRVHVIPELGRAVRPRQDFAAAMALRRLVREVKPAIVHTHTAKAGVLGRWAAGALHPAPGRVHTYHGHVLSGYFGSLTSRAFALTEACLARRTDKLIAVAEAVRDELVDEHHVGRRDQYAIIPPGIDAQRTAPDKLAGAALREQLGVRPDELLVGWVGRLEPVKNLPLAVEAVALARAAGAPLRLLVVGEGSGQQAARDQLSGLPGALHLPGRAQLGDVYGALDVLLQSSRREGLPQVLVEALEAGVPVVASAVGGVPELVRHGVDGLLAEADSAQGLAAALTRMATEPEVRLAMGVAARLRPRPQMMAQAVAARLAEVYAEVLGGPWVPIEPDLITDEALRAVRESGLETGLETMANSGHAAPSCTSSS